MRITLSEQSKSLLLEVLEDLRTISKQANDTEALLDYERLEAAIQKPYKNIKKKDASAIWDLADAGENMCKGMLEKNEKNYLVPKIQDTMNEFLDVKKEIETRLIAVLPKLSDKTAEAMKLNKEEESDV
jgi:hypothetical protein